MKNKCNNLSPPPPPPPQNVVLGGILFSACPSFRDSVIPRFRHSDIIFLRICPVTYVAHGRFCSNLYHTLDIIRHCMFCRKIGVEGSILQELCHFVILTARDHFLRFCSVTLVALVCFCSNFHHTLTIGHCMF